MTSQVGVSRVDTPTCDVTVGKMLEWLVIANQQHTWRKPPHSTLLTVDGEGVLMSD